MQKAGCKNRRVKVGIDVGGTFTHSVAVDADSTKLIGKAMVPTTHRAKEGVALGVVQSMQMLMSSSNIVPDEIALIAHSTTQATNALLEGDVAKVGILGMGKGAMQFRIKSQENVGRIELAQHKQLPAQLEYINTQEGLDESTVRKAVENLISQGAEVFVSTEAFGVDDNSNEKEAANIVREIGYQCTVASEISQLYGLRVRTQTAAINASMLPKMLEAAEMTERSVKSYGISSPLMIMRSDGGIMDINEMRRRPILTMLSGPAAGVAAALMYVHVSDGIFIEVGGTSTDISIIRRGRPILRTAQVGGKRLFLRTLDVRTVGVAGGSIIRLSGSKLIDVGPRSAHIAGLRYVSFTSPDEIPDPQLSLIKPSESDPDDYCAISARQGENPRFALTTTDAANFLGLVTGEYARGNRETLVKVFKNISKTLGKDPKDFASEILTKATDKIIEVIDSLVAEYKLDKELLQLIGGGGAAEVVVPFTAKRIKANFSISQNSEVISAIGVALGLIQETVERNVMNPTEEDILKIRQEALDGVLKMGAAAETIEVQVEIDQRTKCVRATAYGAPELRTRDLSAQSMNIEQMKEIAYKFVPSKPGTIELLGHTKHLFVFQGLRYKKTFFGLLHSEEKPLVVVDRNGFLKLRLRTAEARSVKAESVFEVLPGILEEKSAYGDAGMLPPDVFLVAGARVVDLTSLVNVNQILAVARVELQNIPNHESVVIVFLNKRF